MVSLAKILCVPDLMDEWSAVKLLLLYVVMCAGADCQMCTSEAKNILASGKRSNMVSYRHSINCGYDLALKSFSLWRNPIRCACCCCVVTGLDGLRVTLTASCFCLSDITFAIDKGVFGVIG